MLIDYKNLPENAKVWIYPASKKFFPKEIEELNAKITSFLSGWGKNNIESCFQIHYNRFIVIFTSSNIGTESINQLVAFILELQKEYEVELLDKLNVCFKQGAYVQYKEVKAFKKLVKDKAVNKKTIVFDNLVTTKEEFESFWEVPASESWHKNLFKK